MDPIKSTLLLNYSPIQLATQMSYLKIYPKRSDDFNLQMISKAQS